MGYFDPAGYHPHHRAIRNLLESPVNYPRSSYGDNPWAGVDPNSDHGWGGYQWPSGVPSGLLTTYSVGKQGQLITTRGELQQLVQLVVALSEEKHGYTWINGWCWSYENRPIGGTSTASNHSRGRAIDINAPNNPYSMQFISDIPPDLIKDICVCGFGWGGYYVNQATDAMHIEYVLGPAAVAGSVAIAKALLGGATQPTVLEWISANA